MMYEKMMKPKVKAKKKTAVKGNALAKKAKSVNKKSY